MDDTAVRIECLRIAQDVMRPVGQGADILKLAREIYAWAALKDAPGSVKKAA